MPPPPSKHYWRIKLTTVGDSRVGKSCLIKRYCEKKFVPQYISTIGVDYGVRHVPASLRDKSDSKSHRLPIKVNFFDLSGHESFASIRSQFYSDTSAILAVFDVTQRSSFEHLNQWINEAKSTGCQDCVVCVCANKTGELSASVTASEGRTWSLERGYLFFECSAKNGLNVDGMFTQIFDQIVSNLEKYNK